MRSTVLCGSSLPPDFPVCLARRRLSPRRTSWSPSRTRTSRSSCSPTSSARRSGPNSRTSPHKEAASGQVSTLPHCELLGATKICASMLNSIFHEIGKCALRSVLNLFEAPARMGLATRRSSGLARSSVSERDIGSLCFGRSVFSRTPQNFELLHLPGVRSRPKTNEADIQTSSQETERGTKHRESGLW